MWVTIKKRTLRDFQDLWKQQSLTCFSPPVPCWLSSWTWAEAAAAVLWQRLCLWVQCSHWKSGMWCSRRCEGLAEAGFWLYHLGWSSDLYRKQRAAWENKPTTHHYYYYFSTTCDLMKPSTHSEYLHTSGWLWSGLCPLDPRLYVQPSDKVCHPASSGELFSPPAAPLLIVMPWLKQTTEKA